MAINVACRCGKQMRVGDELAGRRATCPSCGHGVRIPRPSGGREPPEIAQPLIAQGAQGHYAPRSGGASWLRVGLLGLVLLLLAAGTGFAIVYFNQDRSLLDGAASPVTAAPQPPSPTSPPAVAVPPAAETPTPAQPPAPAKPLPDAPQSPAPAIPPPKVEVQGVEPNEPQAGKALEIQLKGNREALSYEYRTEPDAEWRAAPEGKIALKEIKPGPLTIEARATDEQKRVSEVVSRTWLVKSDAPSSFVGISGEPKPEMPEKGRVQGGEPAKEPMKPLVDGGPMPKAPNKPGVQGGDPRRDPQLLVWKLKPADKLYQELHVSQKSAYRIQGLDASTLIQYSVLSSFVVDRKHADGSLNVTQKIEGTRLVQADQLTESLLTGALQKMQGNVYKLTFNAQMEITAFEGQQNPLRVIGGDPFGGGGAFAMASLLDKDGWKEIDQLTFFQPGRPLRQNDRWQKPMTHNWGAFGSWQGQVTYGYGGKQGQFHRVGYAMNLAHAPAKSAASGLPFQVSSANFKHQEAGGMVYFDLEKGRVVGAEERFHVKGVLGIAAGALNAPIEMDEEQAFRVIVYDKNPWQK